MAVEVCYVGMKTISRGSYWKSNMVVGGLIGVFLKLGVLMVGVYGSKFGVVGMNFQFTTNFLCLMVVELLARWKE